MSFPYEKIREITLRLSKLDPIPIFYFSLIPNVGDEIGPYLVNKLTGRPVVKSFMGLTNHLVSVGSIVSEANYNSIIWGSGFKFPGSKVLSKPKFISSVRGPLTRTLLSKQGINCPSRFGDPALVMPLFFQSELIAQRGVIGVVLHYHHQDKKYLFEDSKFKIINVSTKNVEHFIDQLQECEYVISSSLHGLIISDAYSIPNVWIAFENNFNEQFKYQDYYLSLGLTDRAPLILNNGIYYDPEFFYSHIRSSNIKTAFLEAILDDFEQCRSYL
ncbi:polysaccharide pyruvyl transferase family protein [Sessilibacter sp. MAH4]